MRLPLACSAMLCPLLLTAPAIAEQAAAGGDTALHSSSYEVLLGSVASLVGGVMPEPGARQGARSLAPYAAFDVLQDESDADPRAYSTRQFGHDVAMAAWGNLERASPIEPVLQRASVSQTRALIRSWADADTRKAALAATAVRAGLPKSVSEILSDSAAEPDYPAWLRRCLPALKSRLDVAAAQAAAEGDWQHIAQMAVGIGQVQALQQ